MFVTTKTFQPNLIVSNKVRATPSVLLPWPFPQIVDKDKIVARQKRSSLFVKSYKKWKKVLI